MKLEMNEIEKLQEEFKKEPSFEIMMQIIDAYHKANLTERGIGFAEAILLQMDNKERYLQMTMILESVGKNEEALTYLDKILQSSPDDTETLHAKAMILMTRGDINEASSIYIKLKQKNEEDLQAIAGMLICLFKQGQVKEAYDLYQQSSSKLPSESQEWYPKGMIDGILAAYIESSTETIENSENIRNNFKHMEQIIENFGPDAKMIYMMGETAGKSLYNKTIV